jgi:acyl carrier protein phosphodiesterase
MNFLAHLWLADRTGTSLAGAVLGDLVRGSDLSAYPADVALGVRLHRRIDAATDRHVLVAQARDRFPPGNRRYAGIVLDLACDHLLARAWSQFHSEPLADFSARCGQALAAAGGWFEQAGARVPDAGGFAALLRSYAEPAGLERAIQRTSTRLRQGEPLIAAGQQWPLALPVLEPGLPRLLADLSQVRV